MYSCIFTSTLHPIFKLPTINLNDGKSNYWDQYTKGIMFDTDWPTFLSLSNDGFEAINWGLSIY